MQEVEDRIHAAWVRLEAIYSGTGAQQRMEARQRMAAMHVHHVKDPADNVSSRQLLDAADGAIPTNVRFAHAPPGCIYNTILQQLVMTLVF